MKTERRHLRTCLAAAVASSDAEPGRKYSFSFGGEKKKKKVFQPSSGNSVGSHIPLFPNEGVESAEGAARLISTDQSARFSFSSSAVARRAGAADTCAD